MNWLHSLQGTFFNNEVQTDMVAKEYSVDISHTLSEWAKVADEVPGTHSGELHSMFTEFSYIRDPVDAFLIKKNLKCQIFYAYLVAFWAFGTLNLCCASVHEIAITKLKEK